MLINFLEVYMDKIEITNSNKFVKELEDLIEKVKAGEVEDCDIKVLLKKEELMEHLKGMELSDKEVFVTVGAGDIDRFIGPITELLKKHID